MTTSALTRSNRRRRGDVVTQAVPDALAPEWIKRETSSAARALAVNAATLADDGRHPLTDDVLEYVKSYLGQQPFLVSLQDQLARKGSLTVNQVAAVTTGNRFHTWRHERLKHRTESNSDPSSTVDRYADEYGNQPF
jgi:hypothetical protein